MKAGIKTTEFWSSASGFIAGILIAIGVLTGEQVTELTQATNAIVGGIMAITSIVSYVLGRGKVKAAEETKRGA